MFENIPKSCIIKRVSKTIQEVTMENRKIQMGVVGFVVALIFVFFVGAVSAGGLVYLMAGGNEVIREVKVTDNEDLEEYLILEEIFDKYEDHYINDLDKEALIDSAAKGIVFGTGDKYGAYFTEEEFTQFRMEDNGEYVGIGVLVNIGDNSELSVAQVYEGSPAEVAGVLPGDIVIGVNGENVVGMDSILVIDMIKGEDGTDVTIAFNRDGEVVELTMTRAHIITTQAKWFMAEDNIGYIRLYEFSGNASEMFHRAIDELLEDGAQGFILDLRFNPGGDKDIAVEIGDTLFPKGDIITLINNEGTEYVDRSDARYLNMPLVVLINGESASASELISGNVQDYGVGTLVGETTFGKGVAQGFFNLSDGGVLRITSSYYETASGRCPQDVGITPDVEVILNEDVYKDPSLLTTEQDNQMQKALEILRDEIADLE